MSAGPVETPTIMSRRSMLRGLVGFVVLTLLGLAGLYLFTVQGHVGDVAARISGRFFALALAAAFVDFFIGGLRHHIFLRCLVPGTRIWLPIRADLVGRFTGAVTPMQTGGGPGQIFVLYRGGVPLPQLLSVLTINLIATMIFFVVCGGAAVWLLGDQVSSVAIKHLTRWGLLFMASTLGLLLLAVLRPDLVARPLSALERRLAAREGRIAVWTRRASATLVENAERYKASCERCVREWPALPVIAIGLTLLLYLNKFTLGWLVMRGLGFEGPYLLAIVVQAALHLVLFAAPTPGGSGIAELSTGALMALLLPTPLLAPFTLSYRFFLTYFPAALGALLLMHELRPAAEHGSADGLVAPLSPGWN